MCIGPTLCSYWVEGGTRKLGCWFYAPKIVMCSLIWLGTMGLYLFVRLQTQYDPTFYATEQYDMCVVYVILVYDLQHGFLQDDPTDADKRPLWVCGVVLSLCEPIGGMTHVTEM